jgi:hypothetical protein
VDDRLKAVPRRRCRKEAEQMTEHETARPWWQWVLMYPTMIIALTGAIPQYYQWIAAARMGLSPITGDVKQADEQEKAWQRNIDCLGTIDHIKPTSSTDYTIDLISCPSGDILVTLKPLRNPDQQISTWIVTKALFSGEAARSLFTSTVLAQDGGAQPGSPVQVRIVDIKKEGSTVIRRVQLQDNTCIDEMIEAYTGRRLDQKQAPCTKF